MATSQKKVRGCSNGQCSQEQMLSNHKSKIVFRKSRNLLSVCYIFGIMTDRRAEQVNYILEAHYNLPSILNSNQEN